MRATDVKQDLEAAAKILTYKNLLVDHDTNYTNFTNFSKTFPVVQMPLPLNLYIEQIIEEKKYTFLLYDGSSIQVGYKFDNQGKVASHKLVFFFSSLSLPTLRFILPKLKSLVGSREDLIEVLKHLPDYLLDPDYSDRAVVSRHSKEAWQELTWVHGIRLDYDSTASNQADHPQSHATIFDNDCRIAVSHYFDLRRFFLLIFAHLWPFHKTELVPKIRQKIPSRSRAQNLIPTSYPSDYGAFLSF
jgi:hypothetical protein